MEALRAGGPTCSAVVMDVQMPMMDGIEATAGDPGQGESLGRYMFQSRCHCPCHARGSRALSRSRNGRLSRKAGFGPKNSSMQHDTGRASPAADSDLEEIRAPLPATNTTSVLAENLKLFSQIETAIEGGDVKSIQASGGGVEGIGNFSDCPKRVSTAFILANSCG